MKKRFVSTGVVAKNKIVGIGELTLMLISTYGA